MNKKSIIILSTCFIFATALVFTLYAATRKIVHGTSSFLREYVPHAAIQDSEIDVEFNSYYIAGVTKDHVYLGNATAPFYMLLTNSSLNDSQHIQLKIKGPPSEIFKGTTVKVDSPYFYIADGHKPALYRGMLGEWEATKIAHSSEAFFTKLVPISKNTFAIRANDDKKLDNILGKIQIDTPHVILKKELLQKQIDGIFCTDGTLNYNKDINKIIYNYYYRNEFIVYDTNLNLDYRGHTIDTFTRARIKVGYTSSNQTKTLTEREYVSIRSCTNEKYLFVWSNIVAKNDPEDVLKEKSIIDVYDLSKNIYYSSFFIPNYKGIRMREFYVYKKNTLIVMYDKYLVKYTLNRLYTNHS